MKIFPGTKVRLSVRFLDAVGAAQDPSLVTFKIREAGAAVDTYLYGTDVEVVRDGVGLFHFDAIFTSGGLVRYRWEGAGSLIAATEGFVPIEQSAFT